MLIYVAADVAAKRWADDVKLNYPEVVALISVHIMEGARRGKSVTNLAHSGARLFTPSELMYGVFDMVRDLQVEATFPDGSKLCTVRELVDRNLSEILPIVPDPGPGDCGEADMVPGKIKFGNGEIVINEGKPVTVLEVRNDGDRPIQVGSHYHFAEVNPALKFQRKGEDPSRDAARGLRLHIAAGASERFEPNCAGDFAFVPLAGNKVVPGLRGETAGPVDDEENVGQDDE